MLSLVRTMVAFVVAGMATGTWYGTTVFPRSFQEGREAAAEKQAICPFLTALHDVAFYADSPSVLLAQSERLELSDKQRAELEYLNATMRRKAIEILTPQQRKRIEERPLGKLPPRLVAIWLHSLKSVSASTDDGQASQNAHEDAHPKRCATCTAIMSDGRQELIELLNEQDHEEPE